MKKLKRIDPKSTAKFLGLFYAVLGFLGCAIFLIMSLFSTKSAALIALVFTVLVPIFYGIMGLVIGYLMAFIYNLIAERIGGIQIEIE